MKKLKATITKKDGTQKEVFVLVDEQTAEMLEKLGDEKMVNDYLVEEYRMYMADIREQRNAQSLEGYMKQGIEIEDYEQYVFENYIKELENEKLIEAIHQLNREQKRIIEAIFIEGKTQEEVAQEFQISQQAISQRLNVILARLKKTMKKF